MMGWFFAPSAQSPATVDPVREDVMRVNARIAELVDDTEQKRHDLEALVATTAGILKSIGELRTLHDVKHTRQHYTNKSRECDDCVAVSGGLAALHVESQILVLNFQMGISDGGFYAEHVVRLLREIGIDAVSLARVCYEAFYKPSQTPVEREQMHAIAVALKTLVAKLHSMKWAPAKIQS